MKPTPWAKAPPEKLSEIQGICLDIDETLSTRGKLTSQAYSALWSLKEAGFAVVPLTGRPAGWCDHISRFWPVDAVVGENGAFTFLIQQGLRRRLDTPGAAVDGKARLAELAKKIQERFPHAKWASDQAYREYDLAIDICEDVKPWPADEVNELLKLCEESGAHAKLSSIHVNAWFGSYDKKTGFQHWLASGAPGLSRAAPSWEQWLFIGDSPNDEPLFESFTQSVGVANLKPYLPRLKHRPTWITEAESGAGFTEMAQKLVSLKAHAEHRVG